MAAEFGFGDLGRRTNMTTFADKILSRFEQRSFARAVGDSDNSMRLALNLEIERLGDIVSNSEDRARLNGSR